MHAYVISRDDSDYPIEIEAYMGDSAPVCLTAAGPRDVLKRPMLTVLGSRQVPGQILNHMFDAAQRLREEGVVMVGGFHSPVERETLRVFLRSPHPTVVCWARGLPVRLPKVLQARFAASGVLLLSPFAETVRRATLGSCRFRNLFSASLAGRVCVLHALPGSKTWVLVQQLVCRGMPVYTLDVPENRGLREIGVEPLGTYINHWKPASRVSMSGPSLWS